MSILMDGALPGRHGGSSAGGQEALWEEAGEGDEELPSGDVEAVRELVEEATTKGFRSATIDEAANDVAKQDQQKKVFAFFRAESLTSWTKMSNVNRTPTMVKLSGPTTTATTTTTGVAGPKIRTRRGKASRQVLVLGLGAMPQTF
ncbi:expressed unknown protein [Ectocarpus siliculosus]|uniref:Uncharacterized protein n=1 Tax=Ectocarpus siliculosus TaxID=2880 RepID=D7FL02_ECTSI|nr:expressed unknown protein [Ectocarpus siliculosus]|eukprot:CBJ29545.1 expressed unknown protein [Ectocarpus siliculosus]